MVHPCFETVKFLGHSEHRVRTLAILVEQPCDRGEVAEAIGISRATAHRILDDLVRHGWATVDGRTYRATDLGTVVSNEIESLLTTLDAMERLTSVTPWLPAEFGVDLRRLTDSHIILPTHGDPIAPIRASTELMGEAVSVRGLGTGIAPDALRVNRDAVVDDGQSFEVVFSSSVLEIIAADPRMSQWMYEMLEAGAKVYCHENVRLLLGEFDSEVVGLGVADESGVPRGWIESRDADVLNWFETTFERYRDEAKSVKRTAFTS